MAYASITHSYPGGARTFSTGFATGVRAVADIKVAVTGETDGEGNQVYRAFTYDANTGIVTVTNAIDGPYPREVVITRDTPITNPTVDFSAGAVISRANLQKAVLQVLRGTQEAHDNDALIEARVQSLEDINPQAQIDAAVELVLAEAEGHANDAMTYASTALTHAGTASTQAGVATTQAGIATTQAGLATTAKNQAEGFKDDTQDIFDAAVLLLGDIVGNTPIPCTGVYNSELGTGTLELTSLVAYDALVAGMVFKVQAPNTSSAYQLLIRLDGGAIRPLLNLSGGAVPGQYMRTDVITYLTWDGNNFRAGRSVERGADANGEWVRFEDGTQECTHSLTGLSTDTAMGSIFASAASTAWTFPKAFKVGELPACHADVNAAGRWANCWSASNTGVNIREFNATSNASTFALRVSARGKWY